MSLELLSVRYSETLRSIWKNTRRSRFRTQTIRVLFGIKNTAKGGYDRYMLSIRMAMVRAPIVKLFLCFSGRLGHSKGQKNPASFKYRRSLHRKQRLNSLDPVRS